MDEQRDEHADGGHPEVPGSSGPGEPGYEGSTGVGEEGAADEEFEKSDPMEGEAPTG